MREKLSSSLLALAQQGDRWKDDHGFTLEVLRSLGDGARLRGGARLLRFWDRQSGLPNDFSRQELFLAADARRLNGRVFGKVELGPAHEVRYGHREWGARWQVTGELRGWRAQGYEQEGMFLWSASRLGQRSNSDQRFTYIVGREFQAGAADSLRVSWDRYRRDNYVSPELDREQLLESNVRVENRLHYRLPLGLKAKIVTDLERQAVEIRQVAREQGARSRRRSESGFGNTLTIERQREGSRLEVGLTYRSTEARYFIPPAESHSPFSRSVAFVAPDNSSSFFALSSGLRLTPTRRDSLALFLRASKLQYDTPDTNNFDDHDQVRYVLSLIWKHYLSRALRIEAHASAGLYHLVYIFGERSADNYWNRVFRFAPGVEVRPSRALRLVQRFEVLANYVDYDFQDVLQATRSFVYRRFVAEDSLRTDLSPRHRLLLVLAHQLEESGRLYWDEFSERPLTGRSEWRVRMLFRRSLGKRLSLQMGFGYYDRKESRFETAPLGKSYRKVPYGRYIAKGPILGLTLIGNGASTVRAYIQRQKVSQGGLNSYYTNFINVVAHWEF